MKLRGYFVFLKDVQKFKINKLLILFYSNVFHFFNVCAFLMRHLLFFDIFSASCY
jgi:hypothetical protein